MSRLHIAEHEGVQPAQAQPAPVVAAPAHAIGAPRWATKTSTDEEEGGERRIRARAGMKDTGALPDPMAPPAQDAPAPAP